MVTIGADPEILLQDSEGQFVSVEGLVGGTKDAPVPIPNINYGGYGMQEDNVMLEFNIPPCNSMSRFDSAIEWALDELNRSVLQKHTLGMSGATYGVYPPSALESAQARQFGCSPDEDAYTATPAAGVSPMMLGNVRLAGGHVHLGYENPAQIPDFVVSKFCDAYMGLLEVRYGHSQGPRRAHYGTAGRYRPKPYGIEYRTLGNGWLWDDDFRRRVGKGAIAVAELMERGDTSILHNVYSAIPWGEVQKAINTENQDLALELQAFIDQQDLWG